MVFYPQQLSESVETPALNHEPATEVEVQNHLAVPKEVARDHSIKV